ncbi:MAG: alpha/beta hydrolase [Gammaproteobacteria bacterium]|nr:alpha/beta hydrolase [Gammaproteobacteria bacterium]
MDRPRSVKTRVRTDRTGKRLAEVTDDHYSPLIMEALHTLRSADGARLGYRLWREGTKPRRAIVLLHGMASNMTRWSEFVEHTSLKHHWDILRPDLRGHVESFARGRLGLEVWSRDLQTLLDVEHYEKAVVIGHSLGAQVAMHFAAHHPARVQGVVLIDPVFHQALRGAMRVADIFRPVLEGIVSLILFLNRIGLRRRNIPGRDLRIMDEATRLKFLGAGKQEEMIDLYSSPWEDLKYFPVASYLQELLEIIRPLPPLSQIKAPVLALLSKGITYTDPKTTHRLLEEQPEIQIETIDAYHWPLTENPLQIRNTIEAWCKRFPT